MGKRNKRKSKLKPNKLQGTQIATKRARENDQQKTDVDVLNRVDTSDTETASTIELDKPDDGSRPADLLLDDLALNYKELQQLRADLVAALEGLDSETDAICKASGSGGVIRENTQKPSEQETTVGAQIVDKGIVNKIIAKIQEVDGITENIQIEITKTHQTPQQQSNERQTDASRKHQVDEKTVEGINKSTQSGGVIEESKVIDQSKGAIPKTTTSQIKTDVPDTRNDTVKTEDNAQNNRSSLSVGIQINSYTAVIKNGGHRVPYIPDPNCLIGKKYPTVPFKPIFTEDKDFNMEAEHSMTTDYELYCVKEYKRPEVGFLTLEPGVFVLSLGMPWQDDYKIIRTIYPSLRYKSNTCQVEENAHLIEEKVLQYLDNLNTELICRVFEAILKNKEAINVVYFTEYDYLKQMKLMFNYTVSTFHSDNEYYSAREIKSKYCPGRNSKIEKLFQKQTFK